jgi:hypothetical protein
MEGMRDRLLPDEPSAAAWPVVAHPQQRSMPIVGFLADRTPEGFAPRMAA